MTFTFMLFMMFQCGCMERC